MIGTDEILERLQAKLDAGEIQKIDIAAAMKISSSRVTELFNGTRKLKLDEAQVLVETFKLEDPYEQLNAVEIVRRNCPTQLIRENVRRAARHGAVRPVPEEPLKPRPALILAQAILEEQLQVVVVGVLHAVVEALVVVGVGACFEQQPRELDPVLMRRLPQRPFASKDIVLEVRVVPCAPHFRSTPGHCHAAIFSTDRRTVCQRH